MKEEEFIKDLYEFCKKNPNIKLAGHTEDRKGLEHQAISLYTTDNKKYSLILKKIN